MTNYAQYMIAKVALSKMLQHLGIKKSLSNRQAASFSELWALNGDALANIYTGAPAKNREKIRSTWVSYCVGSTLRNLTIGLTRAYMLNLQADTRHEAFQLIVGNHHLASQGPREQLQEAIAKRQRVRLHENFQSTPLAAILLLRRMTAPKKVNNAISFAAAVGWLGMYVVLHKLGRAQGGLFTMKRHGSVVDLSGLPSLPPSMKSYPLQKAPTQRDMETLLNGIDAPKRSASPVVRRKMSCG
jgi:hypothetical protein